MIKCLVEYFYAKAQVDEGMKTIKRLKCKNCSLYRAKFCRGKDGKKHER